MKTFLFTFLFSPLLALSQPSKILFKDSTHLFTNISVIASDWILTNPSGQKYFFNTISQITFKRDLRDTDDIHPTNNPYYKLLAAGIAVLFDPSAFPVSLLSHTSKSQPPKLVLTAYGIEPIVVEVPGATAAGLYEKSLEWVQYTYKSPDDVLKANVINKHIRVSGIASKGHLDIFMSIKYYADLYYTVEIDFKEGKYRFTYTPNKLRGANARGLPWKNQTAQFNPGLYFKKDGSPKNVYVNHVIPSVEQTMNSLSTSLYEYLIGKSVAQTDW